MNCSSVPARWFPLSPSCTALLAALVYGLPALADTVVIRGDRVNVRAQPSLEAEVLAWMKRGETVETQGSAKDGFVRIALPSKVAVWVYAPLVDRASHQVKAPEARLRVGPGRNYGELGVLKKGANLTEIRESDGWLQVEPPAGLSGYVGAQFIEADASGPAKVAAVKTGGILPADGDPVAAVTPAPAQTPTPTPPSPAPAKPVVAALPVATPPPAPGPVAPSDPVPAAPVAPAPAVALERASSESVGGGAQSAIQYSEKVRIVTRVGKVVRSLEPQSPSHYQLRSPQRGEGMLGFLVDPKDSKTPIAGFRGKTVRVVAEEYVDPRYRTQVILRVQSVEEASSL